MSLPAAGSNVAAQASGLQNQFCKGSTLLALKMALKVFGPLEMLNRSLQACYQTVSGMLAAFDETANSLSDAVTILKGMAAELRAEYTEVENLVRYFWCHLLRLLKRSAALARSVDSKPGCTAQ